MCGIGGIYRMGDRPINSWQIGVLANGLQWRGNDATGVASIDYDGTTHFLKNHQPAFAFTAGGEFQTWADENITDQTRIVLVHTRKATKGTPYVNKNNHPLEKGEGLIIHNGIIVNDDMLFNLKKWERSAETDSDVIRAIMDDHGGIDKDLILKMNQLDGAAAVAGIHPATPDKLLLMRDSNPLMIGATDDFLGFASEKKVLHKILKPWVNKYNILMQVHGPNIAFIPMNNQTAWIIGPEGLEYHSEFKCNGIRSRGNTVYRDSSDYHERQERFQAEAASRESRERATEQAREDARKAREAEAAGKSKETKTSSRLEKMPDFVICPNSSCNKHIALTKFQQTEMKLDQLQCKDCKTPLTTALGASMS